MKFRKRPVVIDAIQFLGTNWNEVNAFLQSNGPLQVACGIDTVGNLNELQIPTLEGCIKANKNDWIIKGIKGEFYPCKPDIFEKTYERVEE